MNNSYFAFVVLRNNDTVICGPHLPRPAIKYHKYPAVSQDNNFHTLRTNSPFTSSKFPIIQFHFSYPQLLCLA